MQQFLNKGGMETLRRLHIRVNYIMLVTIMFSLLLTGCGYVVNEDRGEKIKIVATNFPPYDFAREIAGECAEISMLLKPGIENHSYEPTPADIIAIENCDLFIYNGGESDAWVEALIKNYNSPDFNKIKMMDYVDILEEELIGTEEHSHYKEDDKHNHLDNGGTAEYDEHIWTSPVNAVKICESIKNKLIEIDYDNREIYENRFIEYKVKLNDLDSEIRDIVSKSDKNIMIFADRFPFRYFTDEYDIEYRAAFPGCSSQSEPSVKTIAYLVEKILQEDIKNIFYIEFSNQRLSKVIQEETGAKPLLFHSCHNVSDVEFNNGCTYLSLMKNNITNLKEALCNEPD